MGEQLIGTGMSFGGVAGLLVAITVVVAQGVMVFASLVAVRLAAKQGIAWCC
jgi:hypothetical protein